MYRQAPRTPQRLGTHAPERGSFHTTTILNATPFLTRAREALINFTDQEYRSFLRWKCRPATTTVVVSAVGTAGDGTPTEMLRDAEVGLGALHGAETGIEEAGDPLVRLLVSQNAPSGSSRGYAQTVGTMIETTETTTGEATNTLIMYLLHGTTTKLVRTKPSPNT